MGIKAIIFEDDKPESSGCLVGGLFLFVILGAVGLWGYGKIRSWAIGPTAARQERIESIEEHKKTLREEIKEKQKDSGGPFAEDAALLKLQKEFKELDKTQKSLLQEKARESAEISRTSDTANQNKLTSNPGLLKSFEGLPMPISLILTEEVSLLDASGKETPLQSGSVLRVKSRKPSGTLTVESNKATFVGNESRIFGKARISQ